MGYVERCCPGRWAAYIQGSQFAGIIRRGRHGRWNVYHGGRVGYAEPSSGERWNVYVVGGVRQRAGYVQHSYGNRWNVFEWSQYSGYIRAGYAQGPGGVVGGAALLLLFS